MAKINVSKIAGYAEMSVEDKLKALEEFEYEDNASELEKVKNALSKSNSEAADYKKQLKERMSAEELKAKEDFEAFEKLKAEHEELLKKVNIAETKAQYLSLGYDEKLATETAEASIAGDVAKVFANQKIHQEALEKRIKEDLMKGTPRPDVSGSGEKTVTKEQFENMGYTERLKIYNDSPELYAELTKE